MPGQRVGPLGAYQASHRIEAGIEVERPEQRFEGVGADVLERRHPGASRVRGNGDGVGQAEPVGDGSEDRTRDQAGVARTQLSLLLVGEAFKQPFGDREAKDPVADEFKPFVRAGAASQAREAAVARGGAMGQRFTQQRGRAEAIADAGFQRPARTCYLTTVSRRPQRTSNGHSQNSHSG